MTANVEQREALYVSTSMVTIVADETDYEKQGVVKFRNKTLHLEQEYDGVNFRRLDPAYYAWIRSKVENIQRLHKSHNVSKEAWEVARSRFNRIHVWAVERYGVEALKEAYDDKDAILKYIPPEAKTNPEDKRPEGFPDFFKPIWDLVGGKPDGIGTWDWKAFKTMLEFQNPNAITNTLKLRGKS